MEKRLPWFRISLLVISIALSTACSNSTPKANKLPRNRMSAQVPTVPAETEGAPKLKVPPVPKSVDSADDGDADNNAPAAKVSPERQSDPRTRNRNVVRGDEDNGEGQGGYDDQQPQGTPPPVTTSPASQQPLQPIDNCGTPYGTKDADWVPGLPYTPAQQPKITGGQRPTADYTDSSRDGLMNLSIDQVHALGADMQNANRQFANRIDDVSAYTDIHGSGQVEVRFAYEYQPGELTNVTLKGQMRSKGPKGRTNTQLKQTNRSRVGRFAGRISCADQNGGCESTLITIQRLNDNGQIVREAHVVHRFGSAHMQITYADQFNANKIANRAHRAFAQYLSNTVNNSCLAALYEVRKGGRQMDQCRIQKLENECGKRNQVLLPAAKAFAIRTFAVAYGRAGFEFSAIDKDRGDDDNTQNARFLISGPLLISGQRPMAGNPLHVEGGVGIKSAHLIANDGGGNLNLQLVFKGEPNSHTRISLTTLFEPTRAELQGPVSGNPDSNSWVK